MSKTKITPHKGGRTEWIRARCTPEIRKMLDELKREFESDGDLIERLARTAQQTIDVSGL